MTCLNDTYNWLADTKNKKDYTIIHATVERSSDNFRHPHAVIYNKITGDIHEVSNDFKNKNIKLPFMLWIQLGKVSNVKQYEFNEMRDKLLTTKKWDFYHMD